MLSEHLQIHDITTRHAEGDTDLLIAQTTIERAFTSQTIVVGDDTDLRLLLCYHADSKLQDVPYNVNLDQKKWETPNSLEYTNV